MQAGIVDHLWQSIGFFAISWLLAAMLRSNSASIRAWVWRLAALKFVVPFAWLHSLGAWFGFPVRHSAMPPPSLLTDTMAGVTPLAAPAQSTAPSRLVLLAALLITLLVSAACLGRIWRELRRARYERLREEARIAIDWRDAPAAPGFLKTAALTAVALLSIAIPFVAGGLEDRLTRQAALAIDTRTLASARISMRETRSGRGPSLVEAAVDHVSIKRINLKDLVALTYGVGKFEIFGGAMPWMTEPYYDVEVAGPVHAPAIFDPYSLREPMTKYLNEQYGVSIRINGACQEPCPDHESIVVERVHWCRNPLGPQACRD